MTKQTSVTVIVNQPCVNQVPTFTVTKNISEMLFGALGMLKPFPFADFILKENTLKNKSLLCLSPLSLTVGMHEVLVQALPEDLEVSSSEYKAIAELLKPLFSELGFDLHQTQTGLFISGQLDVITTPYFYFENSSLRTCLPQGKQQALLNRLMAECQMVLNQADFNIERAKQGKSPINSVWFWGEGAWLLSDKALTVVTDCDYLLDKALVKKNISSISVEKFLSLKTGQLSNDLVIYLNKTNNKIEKKLIYLNKSYNLQRIWQNIHYQQPQKTLLNKVKFIFNYLFNTSVS